jgi:hypothetical protein
MTIFRARVATVVIPAQAGIHFVNCRADLTKLDKEGKNPWGRSSVNTSLTRRALLKSIAGVATTAHLIKAAEEFKPPAGKMPGWQ